MDMFEEAAADRRKQRGPLAARLRPTSLDEVVGQRHLLGSGRPLRALAEADRLSSIVLWGPAGTGKTTIAGLLAQHTSKAFVAMSAVSAGVKDVRDAGAAARRLEAEHGKGTIFFLDEVHRFSRSQQDALLPFVEDGTLTLIGATTENPFFSVNGPLLSRATLFRLEPLTPEDLAVLADRGAAEEGVTLEPAAREVLVTATDGDGRGLLTTLEVAAVIAGQRDDQPPVVRVDDVIAARSTRITPYGEDDHYDVISAFIKSLRGSDPDAALYYLARMLHAGEDARFIARRLVILASEDIGMADPTSLLVAVAAAQAVEHVGLPEVQLNLAQAVVHLACAPKSNATALGIWGAMARVQEGPNPPPPAHLRDAHYKGAKRIGHGVGYRYPHDDPRGWVEQDHLPPELVGTRFYEPTGRDRPAHPGPA